MLSENVEMSHKMPYSRSLQSPVGECPRHSMNMMNEYVGITLGHNVNTAHLLSGSSQSDRSTRDAHGCEEAQRALNPQSSHTSWVCHLNAYHPTQGEGMQMQETSRSLLVG